MEILLKTIESEFDQGDGWFRIVGAEWNADSLQIRLSVFLNDASEKHIWEITCNCVFSEHIVSECAEVISLEKNHPLILSYKDPEVEIVFSKNKLEFFELFGVVSSVCFKHLGEQPISNWLNVNPAAYSICSSEFGLLGRFPLTVAQEIISVLSEKPISVKFLEQRTPKYWDGEKFNMYPENLEILIIGNSYIIGTGFSAVRA